MRCQTNFGHPSRRQPRPKPNQAEHSVARVKHIPSQPDEPTQSDREQQGAELGSVRKGDKQMGGESSHTCVMILSSCHRDLPSGRDV